MGCSQLTMDLELGTKAVVLPEMGSEVASKGLHLGAAPNGFACLYKGFANQKLYTQIGFEVSFRGLHLATMGLVYLRGV